LVNRCHVPSKPVTVDRSPKTLEYLGFSQLSSETVLTQLIVEAGQGSNLDTEATVRDRAQRHMVRTGDRLSPTTSNEYRRLLDRQILPSLGTRKVRTVGAADLDIAQGWLDRTHEPFPRRRVDQWRDHALDQQRHCPLCSCGAGRMSSRSTDV
jgi:hypothetical protein